MKSALDHAKMLIRNKVCNANLDLLADAIDAARREQHGATLYAVEHEMLLQHDQLASVITFESTQEGE